METFIETEKGEFLNLRYCTSFYVALSKSKIISVKARFVGDEYCEYITIAKGFKSEEQARSWIGQLLILNPLKED